MLRRVVDAAKLTTRAIHIQKLTTTHSKSLGSHARILVLRRLAPASRPSRWLSTAAGDSGGGSSQLGMELGGKEGQAVNQQHNRAVRAELDALEAKLRVGGSEKSRMLHVKRGRKLVRDRLALLLDEGTELLEFGIFGGHNMYRDHIPAGGIVTGIGQIHNTTCVVVANDPTVKGGTYYPTTGRKHMRAQEIAMQNRLPCVYLVDSGGGYLPLQSEGFADRDHFGRVFFNQATMSSAGVPQISVALGLCTAGGAYIPCMSDENIILDKHGHIFLGGPPLVAAATGEIVSADDLGGARLHCDVSGVSDYFADDEEVAMRMCREVVSNLNLPFGLPLSKFCLEELPDIDGTVPADPQAPVPVNVVVPALLDGERFSPFKARFAPELLCGFGSVGGIKIGIIAADGAHPLTGRAGEKGAHFIQLCNQRRLPLVFLQQSPSVGESTDGDFKGLGKMLAALATSPVPKVTLLVGGCFDASYYALCGRSMSPNFLLAWPRARLGLTSDNIDLDAFGLSARSIVDRIVHPSQTRSVLAQCLHSCGAGVPTDRGTSSQQPVFRM